MITKYGGAVISRDITEGMSTTHFCRLGEYHVVDGLNGFFLYPGFAQFANSLPTNMYVEKFRNFSVLVCRLSF
jgi:hypothetical protein